MDAPLEGAFGDQFQHAQARERDAAVSQGIDDERGMPRVREADAAEWLNVMVSVNTNSMNVVSVVVLFVSTGEIQSVNHTTLIPRFYS